MDTSFWIGLVLAVPLAVVGNLLTPRAQKWLSRRSTVRLDKRRQVLRKEFERVQLLAADSAKFNAYLLTVVVAATFVGSVVAVCSGAIAAIAYVSNSDRLLFAFSQFTAIFGGIFIASICQEAIRTSARVRDFADYKSSIE